MLPQGAVPATDTRPLSELLAAIDLSGQTWCYCDLGLGGGFSVPSGDAMVFHVALHGTARITSPAGGTLELKQGEALAVLTGEAHAVRMSPESQAPTLEFLRDEQLVDVPPTFAMVQGGPVAARLLCGRVRATLPSGVSRSQLPSFLRLGEIAGSGWGVLLKPEALALAGMGPGSAALLTRLAALMLVAQLRTDPKCRQIFSPQPHDPIGQALRLISGNPSANWTVERLARSVGMGRSNFAAHFTAQVGRAPMEVVAESRMEQACQLLKKGNLKIAEISELSGYGSEAAFSRRFTRHFGMSPSQMRELTRAESASDTAGPGWQPLLAGRRIHEAASLVRSRARHTGARASQIISTTMLKGFLPGKNGG
ncbi:MAG: helix-turn-helix domain-containing protein [Novosphingobium sp.]